MRWDTSLRNSLKFRQHSCVRKAYEDFMKVFQQNKLVDTQFY